MLKTCDWVWLCRMFSGDGHSGSDGSRQQGSLDKQSLSLEGEGVAHTEAQVRSKGGFTTLDIAYPAHSGSERLPRYMQFSMLGYISICVPC